MKFCDTLAVEITDRTELRRCPELDTSTDPPTAVRETILEHQPLVSLHGHIHESRAAAKLGSTVAIDPGSTYREDVLRGVLMTIQGRRVSYQFRSG